MSGVTIAGFALAGAGLSALWNIARKVEALTEEVRRLRANR